MFDTIKTIIKHCATGIDGVTYDVARIGGMIGVFAQIMLSSVQLWAHHVFDPSGFGIGIGAIIGGAGAAVGLKSKTEPGQPRAPSSPPFNGPG